MTNTVISGMGIAAIILICCAGYLVYLYHETTKVAVVTDKATAVQNAHGIHKLRERIRNWETIVLTCLAAVFHELATYLSYLDENTVQQIQQIPWAKWINAETASIVAGVCLVLIPITHVTALVRAARTPPAGS